VADLGDVFEDLGDAEGADDFHLGVGAVSGCRESGWGVPEGPAYQGLEILFVGKGVHL
jgi:hypothetical protein